jgi:hypothetical protein
MSLYGVIRNNVLPWPSPLGKVKPNLPRSRAQPVVVHLEAAVGPVGR